MTDLPFDVPDDPNWSPTMPEQGLLVPVEDPRCEWNAIRPKGWSGFVETLDIEDQGDGHVKVLWEVLPTNGGVEPPGPFTMFEKGELVELAWP